MPPAAPVVLGGELEVGHPSSAVISQARRVLNAGQLQALGYGDL
jgi:hypothetical protein